ncbi:DUF951 domain-containing protein [Alicyclobacillus mali]|uniref:DUF951 domain-containing protein n=1 Tax=Alicyclobacillus mali (ex Roth et al. 2021) TaxID=1123961 RepID=A0ABS0F066_9BACL|nr:DUF951 domain-containing protein [Alicyclobacillus mali (ex Roth et al. 2021)]MBF8376674.1 DUF951 domain-containing protein [Alicyclobacillus mali (ex Roth et al. 2021)]MCL6489111.1 DUF951 domain-containing protein [Alicyclobacillus mali (ex Roth et al. 2021)]
MAVTFGLGDIVRMKKPHACGENRWEVIRMGMDIRIKCQRCGHSVLIPRSRFERLIRAVIERGGAADEGQDGVSN